MKKVPYNIVNQDGKPYIQIKIKDNETKFFRPEEISAMILVKLKETAEATYFGRKVNNAVLTVPGDTTILHLHLYTTLDYWSC